MKVYIVIAALLFFSQQALAQCKIDGANNYDIGREIVLSNVSIGTILNRFEKDIVYRNCTKGGTAYLQVPQKLHVGSGLSVVFFYNEKPINGGATRLGFLSTNRDNIFSLTYELVRSEGPIAAGDLYAAGVMAKQEYSDGSSGAIHGTVTGRAVLGTCTITTPNIYVPLPEVTSFELPSMGSTFGEAFFNLGVSCNSLSRVYAEFTDSNNQSNSGESLGLGPGSTAKGIKFQVLRDGVLVKYRQRMGLGDIQSDGRISMSVRYIRDGNLVPGRAVAHSAYIISYD
ncbi:fimbrial protein [Pseudomonas sp. R3-52-08]|uniref:fimbrial protein n=1 Tax=Pseudomonas sp. R3-52-08 TaxID=1173284 RepID=UPI000F586E1A|nr:type 1 fimbrial protein [Pseudomonas sp. R3-52-08]AZF20915.1 hypothetical protein C4J91_2165 [Pseudomonas sp. R3-52-08]